MSCDPQGLFRERSDLSGLDLSKAPGGGGGGAIHIRAHRDMVVWKRHLGKGGDGVLLLLLTDLELLAELQLIAHVLVGLQAKALPVPVAGGRSIIGAVSVRASL